MSKRIAIITDLDNTIYNWVDSFAPCFRGMIHALAHYNKTVTENELLNTFRELFRIHGSLEYPVQASELPFYKNASPDEEKRINSIIFGAFKNVAKGNGPGGLRLYDGGMNFFTWAYSHGITIIAVTNAPLRVVKQRLVSLGISRFYTALAAPEESNFEQIRQPNDFLGKQEQLLEIDLPNYITRDKHFDRIYKLRPDELKPSINGYKKIFLDLQKKWDVVYVIGDSLQKDLAPAKMLGAKTIWARYGTKIEKHNLETLLKITPWDSAQVANAYGTDFSPDFTADSLADVRVIVESNT
ncbi:MAG: hypothetical protein KGL39_33285 [Patescibacteria group bacterium]|nr:hypothetical protein [Patescibacteria group bacterium]